MKITGTHFNYYQICRRKLWLFGNGISMEHTSDLVYDGKLIHEISFPQRPNKYQEVEIDGIKVDYYDPNCKIIHELKKSNKIEIAHEWQLKYYIYVFERNGINKVSGVLEYPKLKKVKEVFLSDEDRLKIVQIENEIDAILRSEECVNDYANKSICRNCSYYDFCFCGEDEI